MQTAELTLLNWIQQLRCEFLDVALTTVSRTANHGELWILFALILLASKRQRRYGASVACALVVDLVSCNLILKPLIGRVRPFAYNAAIELLVSPPLDASFPSGHTAAAFAVVFALKFSGSSLWKPVLPVAIVMAFSRLYLYVHWPTDILGGIVLGAAAGWLGAGLARKTEQMIQHKKAGH